MRIKRIAVLGVSAVCILAVLVSIRGNSSIPVDHPSHEDPLQSTDLHQGPELSNIVELHIDVSLDESSFGILEALNENFMKQHPDINVQLRNYRGEVIYDVLARAFRIGEPADIILLDNDKVLSYASKARLKPTDDFYTNEPTAEYVSVMMEQVKWNGYIWAIPYQVQPYVLSFHEQRWFELTGDARPFTAEDVWQVWREGGLMMDTEDPYAFAALLGSLADSWQFAGLTDSNGMEDDQGEEEALTDDHAFADLDGEGTTDEQSVLESEGSEEEMNVEFSMDIDTSSATSTESIEPDEPSIFTPMLVNSVQLDAAERWMMLAQGEITAMVTTLGEYVAHQSDDVGIALLPNQEGDGTALLTGRSFVLSAETKHQEAAYRWIHAMTMMEGLEESDIELEQLAGGAYPASQALYEHPTFRMQPIYRLFLTAIDKGQALAPDPYLEYKLSIVRDALLVDASSDTWSEPTDLMSQIVEKFTANGF